MLLFILFIFTFLLTQRIIKDPISRYLIWIFVIIWSYQIILSRFGLFGLYIPKERTYYYVSIHLFAFYLGYLLLNCVGVSSVSWKKRHTIINIELEKYCNKIIESKGLLIALLVAFIYVLYIFSQFYTQLLLMNSLGSARQEFWEGELFGFGFTLIHGFLLIPFSYLLLFLWGYMTFQKRNLLWVLIGIYLLLSFSLNGSRIDYPRILLCVLVAYLFFVNKKVLSKKEKRKVVVFFSGLVVVLYIIIAAVTSMRQFSLDEASDSKEEGIEIANQQLITYTVGPIVAFDHAINTDLPSKIGGYKYGLLTTSFVEDFFQKFINAGLGIYYDRPITAYTSMVQDRNINISSQFEWNALYTWCNFFYCDMGVLGLFLFPLLFGMFYRFVVSFYYHKPSIYSAVLLYFMADCLVFSIIKYMIFSKGAFIVLAICLYKGNKKRKLQLSKNVL